MSTLTEIHTRFCTRASAQRALTAFRKCYRVALRGACITGPHTNYAAVASGKVFRLHIPLGGTGFSVAEFDGALRALID